MCIEIRKGDPLMTTTSFMIFLIGAIGVNVLVYGGMTLVYFRDKNKPPRTKAARLAVQSTSQEQQIEPGRPELFDAACASSVEIYDHPLRDRKSGVEGKRGSGQGD